MSDKTKTTNEYWIYLENLRRSGVTNMYGATPYLMKNLIYPQSKRTES